MPPGSTQLKENIRRIEPKTNLLEIEHLFKIKQKAPLSEFVEICNYWPL
jgi:hypothetical protein